MQNDESLRGYLDACREADEKEQSAGSVAFAFLVLFAVMLFSAFLGYGACLWVHRHDAAPVACYSTNPKDAGKSTSCAATDSSGPFLTHTSDGSTCSNIIAGGTVTVSCTNANAGKTESRGQFRDGGK